MSIEQYTIGAAATWATPNQPLGLHPIISYCLLCSAAIVILYIRHLHSRIVSCIINMYLDPSVSINCKYKIMNNIRLDHLTEHESKFTFPQSEKEPFAGFPI